MPHLSDIAFRKRIDADTIDPDVVSQVKMKTELGEINGVNPLKLSMPVMVAPMSFGALSASTKRAIGMASTLSGIAENTGEGGMSDAQHNAA
ncbi:MAG: glutamate synthase domain-containing protein 2 [Paracoccaceae bacterium]